MDAYASRAYALTLPQDMILLPERLKQGFSFIRAHYDKIGLSVTDTDKVVWGTWRGTLPEGYDYDEFMYGTSGLVPPDKTNPKRVTATMNLNDKNFFIGWCIANGYPVPDTRFYSSGQVAEDADVFPVFVKAAVSASGQHIRRATNPTELREISAGMTNDYQVQKAVNTKIFLNVQYYADQVRTIHMATTKQLFSGYKHIGNIYPTAFDACAVTDPVAEAAAQLGLRDPFAFDVAVVNGAIILIECNPRYNGATYPTVIARRIGLDPMQEWTSLKLDLPKGANMNELNIANLDYNNKTGEGIIIIAWGDMLGVMVIGPKQRQKQLITKLKSSIG